MHVPVHVCVCMWECVCMFSCVCILVLSWVCVCLCVFGSLLSQVPYRLCVIRINEGSGCVWLTEVKRLQQAQPMATQLRLFQPLTSDLWSNLTCQSSPKIDSLPAATNHVLWTGIITDASCGAETEQSQWIISMWFAYLLTVSYRWAVRILHESPRSHLHMACKSVYSHLHEVCISTQSHLPLSLGSNNSVTGIRQLSS